MFAHLGFLNKNCLRKYPVRGDSSFQSQDGIDLPLSLISGCRFTSILGFLDLFISKVYVKGSFINITISYKDSLDAVSTLGYVEGRLTEDYQTLKFTGFKDFASGSLTTGTRDSLKSIQGTHFLTYESGKLEASVITCIRAPGLHSIVVDENSLMGSLTLKTDNITKTIVGDVINLKVTSNAFITSNNDTFSSRLNCSTKVITGINTVPPDADGNIDIFGIDPVRVVVNTEGITIDIPGLTFADICANVKNTIPPIPVDNPEEYIGFAEAEHPEWMTWPKFEESWSEFI